MHQHTHQHAFTPILHQSLTILPAAAGPPDSEFNTHHPRVTKPSFAPVTAFERPTQTSCRSTKQRRWGALHVSIAWEIYYHQQLKKMQQNPKSLHREVTPECPASSLPDSVPHVGSDRPSGRLPHLDSPRGHLSIFSRSSPSDLYASRRRAAAERERHEQIRDLRWKDRHGGRHTDDSPAGDRSLDRSATPELDRKRPLERDAFVKVKRATQETVERFDCPEAPRADPSPSCTAHAHRSSHNIPARHVNLSDLSAWYPASGGCNVTRAPWGLTSHPYQAASGEQMWDAPKRVDLRCRQRVLKDSSLRTCGAIGTPLVQKEALRGFCAPPLYLPLAAGRQGTIYRSGGEPPHARHLHQRRHQLPHPGFLAPPYLVPRVSGACSHL